MAKQISRIISVVFLILTVCSVAYSEEFKYDATATEFMVSSVFDDGMIFQQNEPIKIWGTSPCEGETVVAVLKDSMGSAIVEDGEWEITLAPRSCSSDPMVLEVYGAPGSGYATYENIKIGDVWWVMGQSNIEYSSSAAGNWDEFSNRLTGDENIMIYDLPENAFDVNNRTRWRKFSRYSAYDSSALACFTAKLISDVCNNEVPLAMVTMGYAGHEIASFMPKELTDKASYSNQKSDIYESVIENIIKMPIKGIIWYQGEADAALYGDYGNKFSDFIEWMRDEKNQHNRDFSVYSVELSPCFDDENDPQRQYIDFGKVRAQSCVLTATVNNFNVCVTSDLWACKDFPNNLHPDNKYAIALRLSAMMLAHDYGFGSESAYFGPAVRAFELSDDKKEAIITFDYVGDGIAAENFSGFQTIDSEWHEISEVSYEIISSDKLRVRAESDIYIIRYNYLTDAVFGESLFLKNSLGIPAAAFTLCADRMIEAADFEDEKSESDEEPDVTSADDVNVENSASNTHFALRLICIVFIAVVLVLLIVLFFKKRNNVR